MTKQAIDALRAERHEALALARSLSGHEWAAASDCPGWRVQDVFAHMGCVFRQVVDPSSLTAADPDHTEARQNIFVAQRRDWTPEQVVADYEDISTRGIDLLATVQDPPVAETLMPLGDLGSHPLHLVANALVFDHYCHLRKDVLTPNGPIERGQLPDDALRLQPTIEWMLAGLPQTCAAALTPVVDRPFVLRLDGPGGGAWTLQRGVEGVEVVPGATGDAAASATSIPSVFVGWGTQRRPWAESGVTVDGDRAYGERVLDAINIF